MRTIDRFAQCCTSALFVLLLTTLPAWGREPVKITELSYPEWLSREPSALIGEFEQSCQTVASYVQGLGKEFSSDKCVGDLFGAVVFIQNSNNYVDRNFKPDSKTCYARNEILAKYQKVVDDVVGKAIAGGNTASITENANLIYTLIHTISRDIVKDYLQTVYEDQEEIKSNMLQAAKENEKRMVREGRYKLIYENLENNK